MQHRIIKEQRYSDVATLFGTNCAFHVPKYQRGYIWEEDNIEDFLRDLDICVNRRVQKEPTEHFFGSILTVETPVSGAERRQYEIIDGQQRLATFGLLVAILVKLCDRLKDKAKKQTTKKLIKHRVSKLKEYLSLEDVVNRKPVLLKRLVLSEVDQAFYEALLEHGSADPQQRESHHRLLSAYQKIEQHVSSSLGNLTPEEKVDRIGHFEEVLQNDCSFVHITTNRRQDAYRLFSVLNDRGMSLSAGDLLRAATLELLDSSMLAKQQNAVAGLWDSILVDEPDDTDAFLSWYQTARTGSRPRSSLLFDDFFVAFFPSRAEIPLSTTKANAVVKEVNQLRKGIDKLRLIHDGTWPFVGATSVTEWDKSRLRLLISELRHTNCMPLLLSAIELGESRFADVVHATERFIFRYKVVCNQHIGSATAIYNDHAKAILESPSSYRLRDLVGSYESLLLAKAEDTIFRENINLLTYSESTGNKALRYFLMTLDDYWRWVNEGANGKPKVKDKSRVFDPAQTTIDHLYPQNASGKDRLKALEPIKQNVMNLTLLGQDDNVAAGKKSWSAKRQLLAKTSSHMSRDAARMMRLTKAELKRRQRKIANAALKIFRF